MDEVLGRCFSVILFCFYHFVKMNRGKVGERKSGEPLVVAVN